MTRKRREPAVPPPPQPSLDFGRDDRVEHVTRRFLRALDEAVTAMGGPVIAAGVCDCSKSELSDALERRAYRYMRVEWVFAIADASAPFYRSKILEAFVAHLGFKVERREPMTPAQRLDVLKLRVKSHFGEAGEDLIAELDGEY